MEGNVYRNPNGYKDIYYIGIKMGRVNQMPSKSRATYTVREEVLNVTLAGLLKKRELLSIPESILRSVQTMGKGKKLPDITLADLWGVRIVIEGRSNTTGSISKTLFRDAKKRIEDGVSPICLAVLYPPDLRQVEADTDLEKTIEKAPLKVRVLSESSDGEWADTNVNGLAGILRRSYELLVSEDVVKSSVTSLEEAIEQASSALAAVKATPARLRKLLGVPEKKKEGK